MASFTFLVTSCETTQTQDSELDIDGKTLNPDQRAAAGKSRSGAGLD